MKSTKRSALAKLLGVTVIGLSAAACTAGYAGFPEVMDRAGRFCGCGWGDGYHACHSSGLRPLANLPPRSYPARNRTLMEKALGCPTCRPSRLPIVGGIVGGKLARTGGETFYDRFDRYAQQVNYHEVRSQAGTARPVSPIVDPEPYRATDQPRFQLSPHDINGYVSPSDLSGAGGNLQSTLQNTAAAESEGPVTPLTPEEIQDLREYREIKRTEQKFRKYLIEPEDMEPSQVFGGPPVGTEQRRKLDEAKLRKQIKRERSPSSPSDRPLSRDTFRRDLSSDDQLLPAPPRDEDPLMSMEKLLPPFPGDEAGPESTTQPNRGIEGIPAGVGERIEDVDGEAARDPLSSQLDLNMPLLGQSGSQPRDTSSVMGDFNETSTPSERVAEVPKWRFVRQPRQ